MTESHEIVDVNSSLFSSSLVSSTSTSQTRKLLEFVTFLRGVNYSKFLCYLTLQEVLQLSLVSREFFSYRLMGILQTLNISKNSFLLNIFAGYTKYSKFNGRLSLLQKDDDRFLSALIASNLITKFFSAQAISDLFGIDSWNINAKEDDSMKPPIQFPNVHSVKFYDLHAPRTVVFLTKSQFPHGVKHISLNSCGSMVVDAREHSPDSICFERSKSSRGYGLYESAGCKYLLYNPIHVKSIRFGLIDSQELVELLAEHSSLEELDVKMFRKHYSLVEQPQLLQPVLPKDCLLNLQKVSLSMTEPHGTNFIYPLVEKSHLTHLSLKNFYKLSLPLNVASNLCELTLINVVVIEPYLSSALNASRILFFHNLKKLSLHGFTALHLITWFSRCAPDVTEIDILLPVSQINTKATINFQWFKALSRVFISTTLDDCFSSNTPVRVIGTPQITELNTRFTLPNCRCISFENFPNLHHFSCIVPRRQWERQKSLAASRLLQHCYISFKNVCRNLAPSSRIHISIEDEDTFLSFPELDCSFKTYLQNLEKKHNKRIEDIRMKRLIELRSNVLKDIQDVDTEIKKVFELFKIQRQPNEILDQNKHFRLIQTSNSSKQKQPQQKQPQRKQLKTSSLIEEEKELSICHCYHLNLLVKEYTQEWQILLKRLKVLKDLKNIFLKQVESLNFCDSIDCSNSGKKRKLKHLIIQELNLFDPSSLFEQLSKKYDSNLISQKLDTILKHFEKFRSNWCFWTEEVRNGYLIPMENSFQRVQDGYDLGTHIPILYVTEIEDCAWTKHANQKTNYEKLIDDARKCQEEFQMLYRFPMRLLDSFVCKFNSLVSCAHRIEMWISDLRVCIK